MAAAHNVQADAWMTAAWQSPAGQQPCSHPFGAWSQPIIGGGAVGI